MAGNYMIRNTDFATKFLHMWEQYEYRTRSIVGFHSSDNGAIHLVVLATLDIPVEEYTECERLYQQLTGNDVKNLTEYYSFVACTRRALGPNRVWELPGRGTLTVVHRHHSFAIDCFTAHRRPGGGIPFYHGEKEPAKAVMHYDRTEPWKSAEEQSLAIYENDYVSAQDHACHQVPRVNLTSCMHNFSCKPATMDGEPRRDFFQNHNDTLIFEYATLFENR